MRRKICGVLALVAVASPAWGFQIRTAETSTSQLEGDGIRTVSVEVERESADPPSQCLLDVTVSARQFANPPFDAATPGSDYTPTTTTLFFNVGPNDGIVTQTFDVPVIDDNVAERGQEFFAAVVTDVQHGDCDPQSPLNFDPSLEASISIQDDDLGNLTLSVDQSSVTVNEAAGTVSLGVTLTGEETVEGDFEVVVTWDLSDGTATFGSDYGNGGTSGSLVFDRTNLTGTVVVPILDDPLIEPDENFDFILSNARGFLFADESQLQVNVTNFVTMVQIADDDSPGQLVFAGEPFQVQETGGSATITLRRTGGTAGTFTAFYRTADGTATDAADYQSVSGSVTWADGDSADKTFTVPILDDAATEGDETVLVQIATDSEFTEFDESTLTIFDNEGQTTTSFATASATATEVGGEIVLTLVRGGDTDGEVSVDFATADGTAVAGEDYVATSGTVTWADGDGADKTIVISLLQDGDVEDAEDFTVNLSNVTGPAVLGTNSVITVTIDVDGQTRDIAGIVNLTPNQAALAGYFDNVCPRLSGLAAPTPEQADLALVCSVLRDDRADDAAVRRALDVINPEELFVSTFNALRLTAVQHGNLAQRLNALRNGASGLNLVGLDLEIDGEQIAGNALQEIFDKLTGGGASADEGGGGRWGGFINGRIATGDQDRSDDEAGFDFDLYSVTAGVDYRIRPNFIVGVSAGLGSVDTDYQNGSGGLDIDNWNGSVYLTYFREQSFYLDALATYGRNEYDSERQIAFGNVTLTDRVARGESDGTQLSFGFGTGWDFNRGGVTFGPHFGGYYFDVDVDGFAETGASGLNVEVDDQSSQSLTVNAGAHVSYAWLTSWGVLVPNVKVDWVHEFEDNRETLAFRFVNDPFVGDATNPSPTITLQSNRPDPNYFIWSAGASAQFIHGFSGFLNYQAYAGYGDVSLGEWSFGARWEKTF